MSKIGDILSNVHRNTKEWMKNPGNISSKIKVEKKNIEQFQRISPTSKYLGFSGIPGVRSQKRIKEDEKEEGQAAIDADKAIHPDPYISSTGEATARKRRAAKRGGRLSTILSDSEGGDGGLG